MDSDVQEWVFSSAERSPASWLVRALQLREAAKRLDWIHDLAAKEGGLGFVAEYRLLLGLSFENLVKGIVVAQRLRKDDADPLRGILHHKLSRLFREIDSSCLALDNEEVTHLEGLTPYIEWAGRYPLPKKAKDYFMRGHSSTEHNLELVLWNRLFAYLKQIGWMPKGKSGEEGWFFLLTR